MNTATIPRLRWHMLWNRHYWWKGYRRLQEQLTRETHLEVLLDDDLEILWSPAAANKYQLASTRQAENYPLRILYVAPRYDYGNPARGLSYEENNFLHVLSSLGHEIIRFDFLVIAKKYGKQRMNKMLVEAAYRYKPDLMFVVLFTDEFDEAVLKEITCSDSTVTINWFADDHWRFDNFSRYWAPHFNRVVTTTKSVLARYKENGIENVILSQWACNHRLYYRMNLPKIYDVSFIGQPHGNRREIISQLLKAGINVNTWGYGWSGGKVTQLEMIRIFNQTKINLNLSNASVPGSDQIKGRNFEIPGCGSFLLTGYAPHLEDFYEIGNEVVCFNNVDDLVDKIRYYLKHEDEREAIATRGYERTLREHTYDHRFQYIFQHVGLAK